MELYRMGPIRPPSEAQSLLLQVTQGCTWNKCKFCNLYRHTKFRAFTIDSIKEDIDRMAAYAERALKHKQADGSWDLDGINRELGLMSSEEQHCYYVVAVWLVNGGKQVFLQDGNTLALSGGRLTEVLQYLKSVFPHIERITSYGRAENLSKVSASEFAELKASGLDRIHSGYESGSDEVLKLVNKGVTSEQQIQAGQNIKAGGIELSVYFMPGLGGKALSRENARGMADVVSQANPDFVRIRTACIKPETELYHDFKKQGIALCSEDEKVLEIRTLITEITGADTRIVSDHIVNLLQGVKGSVQKDKEKMLAVIDEYLGLPERERKLFQIARRLGYVTSLKERNRQTNENMERFCRIVDQIPDESQWNEKMNALAGQYI